MNQKENKHMKKFILVAAVAFAFTACNSGASTEATTPVTDSTTVDSCKTACDSTVVADTTQEVK